MSIFSDFLAKRRQRFENDIEIVEEQIGLGRTIHELALDLDMPKSRIKRAGNELVKRGVMEKQVLVISSGAHSREQYAAEQFRDAQTKRMNQHPKRYFERYGLYNGGFVQKWGYVRTHAAPAVKG